jgi:hypothetical protein
MIRNIADMTFEQFINWLVPIVNSEIFASRERLIALLAEGTSHDKLKEEFGEFFNSYYVLTSELEEYEESVLRNISGNHAFAHMKHRVSAVETQRKSSPLGREARRMGMSVDGDPVPEIKVAALSPNEFKELMRTLGNWRLFILRERLVKLMETGESIGIADRLRTEFCEFFCLFLGTGTVP